MKNVDHRKLILLALTGLVVAFLMTEARAAIPETARSRQAEQNTASCWKKRWGKPVFIRIIKEEEVLELWLKEGKTWESVKQYPILAMSGELGPKQKVGDEQTPEGFYRVVVGGLNPWSSYHLSFNIGYPNRYDRELGRTGSHIMIHGDAVSIGCFAMGDEAIEEIYTLVAKALTSGQRYVPVQVYPFRMTAERMRIESENPHAAHWQHLLPGWQWTEEKHAPYPDTDN